MGPRSRIDSLNASVSGSRVNDTVQLTHRTEAGSSQSIDTADPARGSQEHSRQNTMETADRPNESQEYLTQKETDPNPRNALEETAPFTEHQETISIETTVDSTISPTANQDTSAILVEVVEGIRNLSREDLLNMGVILIGVLPLVWHLSRVFFTAYIPVLSRTPRLVATAIAPVAFGISSCMARAESISQKFRLMSFVASASNGLILILESWVCLYYAWLLFTDDLPPWKTGDTASEGTWLLYLFGFSGFVIANAMLSLAIWWLFWHEELYGSGTDFKERLFSEPKE